MGSVYEMTVVAENCLGYKPKYDGIQSSVCEPSGKSCINCEHLKNDVCTINYYDKVAKSLDEC